jgi:DNA invertase Pin-like site-specific DNA recombinase
MSKPPPIAYSYLRFSTAEQAKGDSLRRQLELRDAWVRKSGVILDDSLNLHDKGVSGFTGKHRENPDRHALAAFLRQVEKGTIPRGSYLIVENLDRLSREHIQQALILFLNLLQAGVRVVQLLPVEQTYDDKSESMAILMAIMELSRGHSESRMKSERIGRAWADLKRQAAVTRKPITPTVPGWLRVEGDHIVAIPGRALVVKRIFRAARQGKGLIAIAKELNADGVPTFGRSAAWNPSTLFKVLHSRAAAGEYQPYTRVGGKRRPDGDPIQGYYPRVVTDAEWWAAKRGLETRYHGGGRAGVRGWNPFGGLLYDARDGQKMYVTSKSKRSRHALVNYGAARGMPGTKYITFPLDSFVAAVLGQLREVDVKEITEDDDGDTAARVVELAGQLAEVESRTATLQAELESGRQEVRAAVDVLRKLEERRDALNGELARARAEANNPQAEAWGECHTLTDALARSPDQDETRLRLRAVIRRVVKEVQCLFVAPRPRFRIAAVQVWFAGGRPHRDYLIADRSGAGNANGKRTGEWVVRSLALPGAEEEFDLRRREDIRDLERFLERADPAAFFGS